jgi:hypothetical protein
MAAMTKHVTCAALDGVEKKIRTRRRRPRVRVVYEKWKNPEPRECMVGGLIKIDTSKSTHQRVVTIEKKTVK